jgi:hypothetical protein
MATRKPRSQPTGIIDVVQDIVSPWLVRLLVRTVRLRRRKGWLVVLPRLWIKRSAGGLVKASVQNNSKVLTRSTVFVACKTLAN